MYGWGGTPTDWRGKGSYDFGGARARYDKAAASMPSKRSYDRRVEPDMDLVNPKGKTISSDSENPIVIAVDVTGSMDIWPGEIFVRLPLLYQTLSKYKPDAEFSFCAIGDAFGDSYPLQVNDFSKDPSELEKKLNALGCEGGGGGQTRESYELFGHFINNHCITPKAVSPFLIIYGDENFYDQVDPRQVRSIIGDEIESAMPAQKMWDGLMNRFNLFLLHKPYNDLSKDKEILDSWGKAIGRQRIITLPSIERSIDVTMGLIAKHWGQYDDFTNSLNARHDDSSLKGAVHHSLRYVSAIPGDRSVMPSRSKPKKSKVTKSLTD